MFKEKNLSDAISLKYFEGGHFGKELTILWAYQLLNGLKYLHEDLKIIHYGINSKY